MSVIIPAAGSGDRMGSDIPKPLLKIGGKSILELTISRFTEVDYTQQIIIAAATEFIPQIESLFKQISLKNIKLEIVEGGKERQHSIFNALNKVESNTDIVVVHDAVRPFIRTELIMQCCEIARKHGGAVIGVPAKDTIKEVGDDNIVTATPNRSKLWQAQTPQVFQYQLLIDAYESAVKDNYVGTDDASLVERIGGDVMMVEGDRKNLKITYPVDLEIAKLIHRDNL